MILLAHIIWGKNKRRTVAKDFFDIRYKTPRVLFSQTCGTLIYKQLTLFYSTEHHVWRQHEVWSMEDTSSVFSCCSIASTITLTVPTRNHPTSRWRRSTLLVVLNSVAMMWMRDLFVTWRHVVCLTEVRGSFITSLRGTHPSRRLIRSPSTASKLNTGKNNIVSNRNSLRFDSRDH